MLLNPPLAKRLAVSLPCIAILLFAAFGRPPQGETVYDSARWIDSGLEDERSGDWAAAEKDLLEAARVDRLYQPRWTLAGFYFRRNRRDEFWASARQALEVGRRDFGALFDLCWQITDNPDEIWTRIMPDRKATWNEYLLFLTNTNRWVAAGRAAQQIAGASGPEDKPLLVNYCDAALEHGDPTPALGVWKALCRRHVLPFPENPILTNGDFREAPSGRGFDWIVHENAAVTNVHSAGEERFILNGFQSGEVVLLEQRLALDPSRKYQLAFEYKSAVNGIHWRAGASSGNELRAQDWTGGQFEFDGSSRSLVLMYQRPSGSTTVDGEVSIRRVEAWAR